MIKHPLLKTGAWLLAAICLMALLLISGAFFIKEPDDAMRITTWANQLFWPLTFMRWSLYVVLFISLPLLAKKLTHQDTLLLKDATRWRMIFLRLAAVYELFFPFDILNRLAG